MPDEVKMLYVCPGCFLADESPGQCPICGRTRVECNPGDPDNPCRRPPMDAEGRLLSRAPLWWLVRSVPYLRNQVQDWLKG
jgi:hypothetical protein